MAQQKKDGIVHVRVNADDKEAAEAIYADMGTSLSEAVRMFIHESIKLNTLPFRPVSGLTKGKMQAAGALHIYANRLKENLTFFSASCEMATPYSPTGLPLQYHRRVWA